MIDVINLKKSFGDVDVLKGIDVKINKGDIVVVIGPSGSGKSTFLRCLNCMEDPTGGSIIFNGVDIADMSVDINIHRRHMGWINGKIRQRTLQLQASAPDVSLGRGADDLNTVLNRFIHGE